MQKMNQQHQLKQLINQTESKRTLQNQILNKEYYNNNFKELLELGQHFEKLAVERIIKYYNFIKPKITFNNDSKYDIKINKRKYEIKTDIKCIETNNIFIEYMSNNKLSGISITEAKYYLIIIPYEENEIYLLIKVRKLKELIEKKTYFKHFTPNKYNNFSGGFIFTLDTLQAVGKLI